MKFFLIILLAVSFLLSQANGQANTASATGNVLDIDNEDAKLLVAKNILNNYIVEGADVAIKYNIYNVGNLAALNVRLNDENFPADRFEYVTGFNKAKWTKIQPSTNVSHIAIVRPKVVGPFNLTHATVTYTSNEKTSKVQTGYSTEVGEIYIQRLKDYNRRFASHTIDWILFIVMASPSILFPYLLWFNSKSKYEKKSSSQSQQQPSSPSAAATARKTN